MYVRMYYVDDVRVTSTVIHQEQGGSSCSLVDKLCFYVEAKTNRVCLLV